jgi:hypothetical protein
MATPSASVEAVLSAAEVVDRIRSMSDADKLRFKKASQYFSYGGARPPGDLRNEAIRRAADGTRKCRSNLSIIQFLLGVLRSIASSDRKAFSRSPLLKVVPRDGPAAGSLADFADPRLSPEDQMIRAEEFSELKRKFLNLFEDDAVAQTIAEGMIDEMEGAELRELVGLSDKDFATKRRLVRRRIDKAIADGWKP